MKLAFYIIPDIVTFQTTLETEWKVRLLAAHDFSCPI